MNNEENSMVVGADAEYEERFGGPEEDESGFEMTDEDEEKVREMCLEQGEVDRNLNPAHVLESEDVLLEIHAFLSILMSRDPDSVTVKMFAGTGLTNSVEKAIVKLYEHQMSRKFIRENK